MRAIHGQLSDNQPIRRSLEEKQKQLRDLKETLASMKSHTSPALKESIRKRVAQLEAEVRAAPALKTSSREQAATARPATTRGADNNRPQRRGNRIRALTSF
ncbi:MAG: hypothetical protein LKH33_00285 [Acetobacter sp.]|jgi:FKBP-type peptidyl-prolyl cis-trans isomerase|nr:hypothetical protein [Acetobacter sp.]MCH4062507.1 hypothetical protein [Acetobacter sp.]MCH4088647.1 hypothetical protein [Acetobacter sp.]MCI1292553.1 hypothetical protein [Acetobacter sp.]MCI1319349.1 hypothetical protein [Acetobacter sp.]